MSLKGVAKQTLEIIEQGGYEAPGGGWVELGSTITAAVTQTETFTPDQLRRLLARAREDAPPSEARPVISVTGESTQEAARRLVEDERIERLVLLNFASAKNAGGGFINGAQAQEEDLARCSALYPCLRAAPMYYEANRSPGVDALYTDHMIYSPEVPFFRVHSRELLERAFMASVITAPAPNAGVHRGRGGKPRAIERVLRQRAGYVLALAEARSHRHLLLGAWGCGVFRNDPNRVADAFGEWLEHERFAGSFDSVCFAILDRGGQTRAAFERRLEGALIG
jgi:uncharacterized protein (TIGR02452 family)